MGRVPRGYELQFDWNWRLVQPVIPVLIIIVFPLHPLGVIVEVLVVSGFAVARPAWEVFQECRSFGLARHKVLLDLADPRVCGEEATGHGGISHKLG